MPIFYLFLIQLIKIEISIAFTRLGDLYRRNIHHTCEENNDCFNKLKVLWSAYQPICCTTIVCDEKYGNYYLVRSGCASRLHCQPNIQLEKHSRFAARMEKQLYDSLSLSAESNCTETRQKASSSFPNVTLVTISSPTTTTTVKPISNIEPVNCTCTAPEVCCIHITCKESLQKSAKEYTLNVECAPSCRNYATKINSQYSIYMTTNAWENRGTYERMQSTPPVESSCRETIYFYQWLPDHWSKLNSSNAQSQAAKNF